MIEALFLVAYTCSGLAGLVYEVSWTRLLTLEMGHGLAASSTVLAAFMGGLAIGSVLAGRSTARLSAIRALKWYAALELTVAVLAVAVPFEIRAAKPILAIAYQDGAGGLTFALVRLAVSLALLLIPTLALGATFPLAVRWFATERRHGARQTGRLYAANIVGAAVGSVLAGFVLLPSMGIVGTLLVGASASLVAAGTALALSTRQLATDNDARVAREQARTSFEASDVPRARRSRTQSSPHAALPERAARSDARAWPDTSGRRKGSAGPDAGTWPDAGARPAAGTQPVLAATLLAITGLATFSTEVAWTRVYALLIGPSTYAFAATVATFVSGLAIGAMLASLVVARTARPAAISALCFALAATASVWATGAAGTSLPHTVALEFAASPGPSILTRALWLSLVVLPMAMAIGAVFPLALQLASDVQVSPRTLGMVYAVNTIAGVVGSLATGFVLIPALGLERTLTAAAGLLALGAIVAAAASRASTFVRALVLTPLAAALALFLGSAPWNRDLLASGAYNNASAIAPGLDVESALTAGTLVYYRDGATATVSVKRLAGTLSLAIDGKIDASTGGDMLTQKLLAHLPLLLSDAATRICIIGLGSGITAASALSHPVTDLDVLEISPDVAEASRLFAPTGRSPLDDPRTRLLVADGRTHLALSSRTYDVIVAEPSNPWMAGVAALFTREFFLSARQRLSEHGIICQWVNTYDISLDDLKSVVATFASVFPHATLWLVGDGDLLMVGSLDPQEPRIERAATRWATGAAAADLQSVGVTSPFVLLSMYVGGDTEAATFARGAAIQVDDRMALEFSAPRALHRGGQRDTVSILRALQSPAQRPAVIARAWAQATGLEHAHRSVILRRAGAFEAAYDAAATAVDKAPDNETALRALVDASAPLSRQTDAAGLLAAAVARRPDVVAPRIALSRLHASMGAIDPAIADVGQWLNVHDDDVAALEQLASVFADVNDADRLGTAVQMLSRHPERAGSAYYAAAHHFLRGELDAALASAQHALTIDPTFARAQNLVGAIEATRGDTAAARAAFEASLALDAQDPATYQNLATLELNSGNRAGAARLFEEALSIDPSSGVARQGLERARAAP